MKFLFRVSATLSYFMLSGCEVQSTTSTRLVSHEMEELNFANEYVDARRCNSSNPSFRGTLTAKIKAVNRSGMTLDLLR